MRMSFWRLVLLTAFVIAAGTADAAAQSLSLTLDRPDWVYRVGEEAEWRVTSNRDARVVLLFTYEQQRLRPLSIDTLDMKAGQPVSVKRTITHAGLLRA